MKNVIAIQSLLLLGALLAWLWNGFDIKGAPYDSQWSYPDGSFVRYLADVTDAETRIRYIMFAQQRGEMIEVQGKSRYWPRNSPDFLRLRLGNLSLLQIDLPVGRTRVIHILRGGGVDIYDWRGSHADFLRVFQPFANDVAGKSIEPLLQSFMQKEKARLRKIAQQTSAGDVQVAAPEK